MSPQHTPPVRHLMAASPAAVPALLSGEGAFTGGLGDPSAAVPHVASMAVPGTSLGGISPKTLLPRGGAAEEAPGPSGKLWGRRQVPAPLSQHPSLPLSCSFSSRLAGRSS